MTAPSTLHVRRDGAVATVALANPATLNALGPKDCRALIEAFDALAADGGVRAAILTGEGRAFCSGANMQDAAAEIPAGGTADLEAAVVQFYNPLAQRLRTLPFPLVAAVNGIAAGIGSAYALAADMVVAAETASFSFAFRRVGLVPDGGSTWLLPRLVGQARAMELVMLGEPLPAPRALEWGLIARCVPDEALTETAHALAANLAEGPAALGLTRRLMWEGLDRDFAGQLAAEATTQGQAGRTADFAEGVHAFLERRKPRFSGR